LSGRIARIVSVVHENEKLCSSNHADRGKLAAWVGEEGNTIIFAIAFFAAEIFMLPFYILAASHLPYD
jgi:hypothetical protein